MGSVQKQKVSTYNLLARESGPINPMSPTSGGRQVRNFIPRKGGYLERKTAAQRFLSNDPAIVAQEIWHIIDFKYQDRAGGDHSELLYVKDDGRIYIVRKGGEEEIYPRYTVRPRIFSRSGTGTATNPQGAIDWDSTSKADIDSGAGTNFTEFYSGAAWGQRLPKKLDSLTMSVRSEVPVFNPGGTNAAIQYSLWNKTAAVTTVNFYVATATRALQTDTVSLAASSLTDIYDIEIIVIANATGGTSVNVDVYDINFLVTPDNARILNNPRDVAWVVANNKLFISDGDQTLVYLGQGNGGGWYQWGMDRPTNPTATRINDDIFRNLTNTNGRKYATTWVQIVDSIRIHESSRSDIFDAGVATSEYYNVFQPPSPPERTTHWSIYPSAADGSLDLFRLATLPISTTSHIDDSTDFGAAGSNLTSIRAPERNDIPPKSKILELHRSRIFARNEEQKNEMWHSALGEVRAGSNGAAEESFPGFAPNTISDLQNFIDPPTQTDEMSAYKSWNNDLWFLTRREGFRLVGSGGLQDNFVLRDFEPVPAFRVGCAGPHAITTCPFGLAFMSSDRQLYLYSGGGFRSDATAALFDIGFEKQILFDRIPDQELQRSTLLYHRGLNSLVYRFQTYDAVNHLLLFSFDTPDQNERRIGGWYEFTDVDATGIGLYFDVNKEFLLVGEADGELRAIEQISGNSVIGKAEALIGKIVIGASAAITNYPAAIYRTANTNLGYDGMKVAQKIVVASHRQSVADNSVSATNVPTIAFWDDILDPESPGTSTSVTLSGVTKVRNFRGHLGSAGGTLCDRIMAEISYATGAPEGTADGNDFLECNTSRINGLGLVWAPKEEQFPNP